MTKILSTVVFCAMGIGCFGGAAQNDATPNGGTTPTTTANVGMTNLPCDVQQVLADHCWSCHGTTPVKGVPTSLVTYDDLSAKDGSGKTFGELAAERMNDSKSPMPPTGVIADAAGVLKAWVDGGMKQGTCGDSAEGANAPDPYDTPTVCTSKKKWTGGDHESPDMHPGVACIACHEKEFEAPTLTIAGTVYPTAHEPDDCNGVPASAGYSVVITDADGKDTTIKVSHASGNFYFRSAIKMPYRAKVIDAKGNARAMSEPQKSGDCNACHTVAGTHTPGTDKDAPGRIMAP